MEGYQNFAHDSIWGGLNLIKRDNEGNILDRGVRPPYPIIISNPTVLDSIYNLNKADLGIVLFGIPISLVISRYAVKDFFGSEHIKRRVYKCVFNYSMVGFVSMACFNSAYRLSGLIDNGLTWKRKSKKLDKYDFTKDFESKSFWKNLRTRY